LVEATTTSGNPCTVVTFGTFIGYDTVNTNNSPTWALGDTLYIDTTPGGLTNVAPAGESSLIQNIGKVQRVDSTDGRIKVGGAGRTNAVPNLNEGRLFVGNASNRAVADGTIHVDIANTRVGINDTTPSYTLDVNGTFRTTGNSIIGDGVGDTLTINAGTIDVPSISAGTDNTVLVYNGSSIVTDEIDSRVWGSSLVDGSGTSNTITKWSDSNTVTDSLITDDGTTVSITTNTTSDALLITSTEDSSSAAPVITLKRNSSTPADGDYIGQIKFKGENDADQEVVYAKITGKIDDASDTTEDGLIEYMVKGNGSNVIAARLTSSDLKLINGIGLEVAGNTTLGDASGDSVTINAATIALANVAAGTDNTVLVYNGSSIVTDEIDSRVWGSTLVDGSGTATYVTKWSDSNTVTDSVITDDGSTVTIGGNLTVNGTTTTLNATNSVVTDNLFELNSGVTSNANDSGIIIERGSTGDNALFIWDESADKFALGTTTATADSTGNITYTDAGLRVSTLETSGNVTLGDASGDSVTINAATIALANVAAGTDNTVLVYNGSSIVTDEIDSRVWGSTLVDGSGTANTITKWSDSNTVTDSLITDDGTTVTIGANDFVVDTDTLFVDASTDRVGIGTSTPANTLDIDGSLKINGEVVEKAVNTTGVSGSTALDPANGTVQRLVFSGDVTFTDSLADGESITLHIDDGPDSPTNTATWPTITWATGSAPTLNTSTDTIVAVWKVNSTLYGATVGTSQDVVSDTTPQLGGNLDVNGKDIVSVSNGDIELAPDGTGVVVFKGDATKGSGQFKLNCEQNSHAITIKGPPHSAAASYTLVLPNDDGTSNQVLTTDGSGNLSWSTPSGSYGDSDVDTHLNTSSASSGEVLSWNGSDYAWVANSGSSGGTSGTSDRIISIDAGALVARTTNGAASATEEYATNDVMSDHFLFDGATEEGVQFRFHMPSDWDGNAVNAKFYWDAATGASAADGVTWGIAMQAFQNDDALDNAFGTSVDTDDAVIAVGDLHVTAESSDITIAGSPSAGDLIVAEVTRVVGDANDTMTEDAKLIGVTIHYTASVSSQVSINAQTGTTYTTVLTDASKLVTLNNASAITLTIPPNSSVAYPVGTKIDLLQIGAGQVTVAGGSGVTVNSTPTLKLRAQYSGATCIQYAADTWILAGDLAAS
jgi:microcompartment protein CcmK/EutM